MDENKRQHYVPQVYLRCFSDADYPKKINR